MSCKHFFKIIFLNKEFCLSLTDKILKKTFTRPLDKKLLFFSQFLQNRKAAFIKTLCFIHSNVFFSFQTIKKARKEKHIISCVSRECCLKAHYFLSSLKKALKSVGEQKRLEIKRTFLIFLYMINVEQKRLEIKCKFLKMEHD